MIFCGGLCYEIVPEFLMNGGLFTSIFRLKKTARKAMSSFTPQFSKKVKIESKPEVDAEVINLSDDEPGPDVGSSGKAEKEKKSESPASSFTKEGVEKKGEILTW